MKRLFCVFILIFSCVFGAICEDNFNYYITSYGKEIECYSKQFDDGLLYIIRTYDPDDADRTSEERFIACETLNTANRFLYDLKKRCIEYNKIKFTVHCYNAVDEILSANEPEERFENINQVTKRTRIYSLK